jgi:hypothetical protein
MRATAKRHEHLDGLNKAGKAVAFPRSGTDRAFRFTEFGIAHDSSLVDGQ